MTTADDFNSPALGELYEKFLSMLVLARIGDRPRAMAIEGARPRGGARIHRAVLADAGNVSIKARCSRAESLRELRAFRGPPSGPSYFRLDPRNA